MTLEHRPVDRRKFLQATAAAGITLPAASYAGVVGSLTRVNLGFIGCGGRAQAHINLIVKLALDNKGVSPMAVCDVWDGQSDEYDQTFGGTTTRRKYAQGLHPSADKCGLNPADKTRVMKDYRRLLDLKDIDAVCISTPDHLHARQTLDAFAAGKDVYVERPMTRTAEEAIAVSDAAVKYNRVLTVGHQLLTDPTWQQAHQLIQQGKLGQVTLAQTGVFRNDIRGQWRFYRVTNRMNTRTIDWDKFLGEFDSKDHPFQPGLFAQWRCYRPFSGGPITDMLATPLARMLAVTGYGLPYRVTTSGGLFAEHDGRNVPDVVTVAADFPEGGQLQFTLATTSGYPTEEIVRGRLGCLKFVKGGIELHGDDPRGSSGLPARLEQSLKPKEIIATEPPKNETETLWLDFLDCVRSRKRDTVASLDIGSRVSIVADMAVRSYEHGCAFGWDTEKRSVVPADAAWLQRTRKV